MVLLFNTAMKSLSPTRSNWDYSEVNLGSRFTNQLGHSHKEIRRQNDPPKLFPMRLKWPALNTRHILMTQTRWPHEDQQCHEGTHSRRFSTQCNPSNCNTLFMARPWTMPSSVHCTSPSTGLGLFFMVENKFRIVVTSGVGERQRRREIPSGRDKQRITEIFVML